MHNIRRTKNAYIKMFYPIIISGYQDFSVSLMAKISLIIILIIVFLSKILDSENFVIAKEYFDTPLYYTSADARKIP